MADVKTIDQRLREAALEKAYKEMDVAISKLANLHLGRSPFGWTSMPAANGGSRDITSIMKQAGIQYINSCASDIGNEAVKEFMEKVEQLNTEMGELRNMVEDLPRAD